jgi:endonuclease III
MNAQYNYQRNQTVAQNDEVCPHTGMEYVAYDQVTGELLTNVSIFEKKSENLVFIAVVAKRLQELYTEKFAQYKESLSRMQGLSSKLVSTKLQESMKDFFANLKGHIRRIQTQTIADLHNSKNIQEINHILKSYEKFFCDKQTQAFVNKRDEFLDSIRNGQFTTIAMNKTHYDDIIQKLDEESHKLEKVAQQVEARMDKIMI